MSVESEWSSDRRAAARLTELRRRWPRAVVDGLAMVVAVLLADLVRYDFGPPAVEWRHAVLFSLLMAACTVGVGASRGLYLGRSAYGSFEEVKDIVPVAMVTGLLMVVVAALASRPVPLSVPIISSAFWLVIVLGTRYLWRATTETKLLPSSESEPLVVVGAGEGGQQIVTALLRTPTARFRPVALLDDDPAKRHLRIRGVPVRGGCDQLEDVAAEVGARRCLVAIPSTGSAFLRDMEARCEAAGLELMVLPSVSELYGASLAITDIRPASPVDLLGRHELDTDVDSIAGYITGRRVLVTGAGGSIGAELCRQLVKYAPAALVMLDRDESGLHAVQLSVEGRALLDDRSLVVASIRDAARIDQVFTEHRPEVVFHAAALKHLPLLEMYPSEAFKTNVVGTKILLDAACRHGVERFVNISTDKAADPASVLGYSKRIAERLTAEASARCAGTYLSVRFGNVLGSRGSVLHTFSAQIDAGGPVTVTHPDVTRFLMTVEEAVQLVIQAGAVGRKGEALVLDMGVPVRINDLAERLIREGDRRVDIVYTGLRSGEKLHEVLFAADERDSRPCHPRISHVPVPALSPRHLPPVDHPEAGLAVRLRDLCGVGTPMDGPEVGPSGLEELAPVAGERHGPRLRQRHP